MDNQNLDFLNLLNTITNTKTFEMELSPKLGVASQHIKCKYLSTLQLKELIKTIVDSPLTQANFNVTAGKIFKESILSENVPTLSVIDRLFFILESRINSIAATKEFANKSTVNYQEVLNTLREKIKSNNDSFLPTTIEDGGISLTVGVGLLEADIQMNEEMYKGLEVDTNDDEQLRKILGDSFLNEIAKSIYTVTIENSTLDLSTVNFRTRLQVVERLPASLVQKVVSYIEVYKKIVDQSLIVENESIDVDGSLFSYR
jgi:hypothetical protein